MDKVILLFLFVFIVSLFILGGKNNPTQNDVQSLNYAKNAEKLDSNNNGDFPYPQLSNGFQKLTEGIITPINNLKDLLPNNSSTIDVIRNKDDPNSTKRYYLPDYYRKDRLCENDIGSEELRPVILDDSDAENSWTEINVSDHPKYYTSNVKNELTNIGSFFDKNNQYHDKTSHNTESIVSDNCYTDKMGNLICEDKTRLQNVPPSLISDKKKCGVLNGIGDYSQKGEANFIIEKTNGDSQGVWSYNDDKLMNGNKFFNKVFPSKKINESYSIPSPIKDCESCPFI
jgi:hypothetical protein